MISFAGAAGGSRYGVVHGDRPGILVEGGFGWTRMDFNWNAIEPENGTFTFDQYDSFVENCTRAGIRILAILDYSANWASSGPENWPERDRFPPKHLSDWEDYVFATVTHFKDKVKHWEVWNEPNIRYFWFPKADPKEYFQLLRSAYLTAKKADPECTVLIGGVIGFDVRFLREVYVLGGSRYFDVMAIHPYMDKPYDVTNFTGNMSALRALMAEFGDSKKEIWFTELSWTPSANVSMDDQAAYLVRSYVVAFAEGADKLFWFNLNAAPAPEESSGLIERDLTPRPAFWAHKALVDSVGEAQYERRLRLKGGVEAHLFRRGEDEHVLVTWSPNSSVDLNLRLASDRTDPELLDMLGQPHEHNRRGRSLLFKASPYPVFITRLTDRDVSSMEGKGGFGVLSAVAITGVACLCMVAFVRRRRRAPSLGPSAKMAEGGPRRAKARDVPAECERSFKDTVCLKCRHYVVRGGRGHCERFNLQLE